jgi:uncharacterized delta-60 repeat protein
MRRRSLTSLRRLAPLGLLVPALLAGCDDAPSDPSPDMAMMTPADMTMVDPPDLAGIPAPTQVVQPISAAGDDAFYAVALDPQGRILAAGVTADATGSNANFQVVVARYSAAGVLDTTYGVMGFAKRDLAQGVLGGDAERVRGMVVQSTGKVVVAAQVESVAGERDLAMVRFDTVGQLDTTFGDNGVKTISLSTGSHDQPWGITRDGTDRLLVSGAKLRATAAATDTDWFVARFDADGKNLDNTFGTMGPDHTPGLAEVDLNNHSASPRNLLVLPDNSIVMAGYYRDGASGPIKPSLFKLTTTGALDTNFGANGIFTHTFNTTGGAPLAVVEAYGAALQGNKLVTTGYGRDGTDQAGTDWMSIRVDAMGMLDTTYGNGGIARIDIGGFQDNSRNHMVLPDNRVVLVGGGKATTDKTDATIVMLTENGQRDTSFGDNGVRRFDLGSPSDVFWGVTLSPDGKSIVAVGLKGAPMNGNSDAALVIVPFKP